MVVVVVVVVVVAVVVVIVVGKETNPVGAVAIVAEFND